MTSSEDILSLAPPAADLRVAYGGDGNQFVDLRLPRRNGPCGLAICIHGGYWRARYDLGYMGHLCSALTARGIATANLEYRRVGNSGGGWPGTFADVRAAYQFLTQLSGKSVSWNVGGDVSKGDVSKNVPKNARRYEFDLRRVVVIGHSAGGQLGLCLAAHENGVKVAISLAGVVDLQRAYELHLSNDAVVEFLGGSPAEVGDHYREADPMKLAISARQWLVHGAEDDVVPPALSRDYVAAKKKMKEDARLVEIAGAGHFEVVDPRAGAWGDVERLVMEAVG
jgi:acetyl esterase/lipase